MTCNTVCVSWTSRIGPLCCWNTRGGREWCWHAHVLLWVFTATYTVHMYVCTVYVSRNVWHNTIMHMCWALWRNRSTVCVCAICRHWNKHDLCLEGAGSVSARSKSFESSLSLESRKDAIASFAFEHAKEPAALLSMSTDTKPSAAEDLDGSGTGNQPVFCLSLRAAPNSKGKTDSKWETFNRSQHSSDAQVSSTSLNWILQCLFVPSRRWGEGEPGKLATWLKWRLIEKISLATGCLVSNLSHPQPGSTKQSNTLAPGMTGHTRVESIRFFVPDLICRVGMMI